MRSIIYICYIEKFYILKYVPILIKNYVEGYIESSFNGIKVISMKSLLINIIFKCKKLH